MKAAEGQAFQMAAIYPETRVDEVTETLTGVSFPDPYRWLEADSEEVRCWQHAQAQLACAHVREWPHSEKLRQLVARFSIGRPDRGSWLPRHAAGRWFRMRLVGEASQAQALVAYEPMGEGRVLFDPLAEGARPPFLSWVAPSPDGRTLAIGTCTDGSENNNIRLIDVETGLHLADPPLLTLMDNWTGGVHWLPDSTGFFFSAIAGAAIDFEQDVYLHRRVPHPTTIKLDIPWVSAKSYRMVVVSRDGRHALALERLFDPIPVAIARIDSDVPKWRPFITQIVGAVAGHVVGDRYIAVTDVGAPRGRLVAVSLNTENPNDPNEWVELVKESEAVLRTVTPVDDVLYLTEFVDTYARVRIVDLAGKALGEVPLPGRGAIASQTLFHLPNLMPKGDPQQFLFAFSSLTTSPAFYRHTPGQANIETLQEPQVKLEHAIVEDHWAVSRDGARVPYHVVRRADVSAKEPQPTLIHAYGAFNAPFVPQFPGAVAAFIAAGGVLVHAHLRGGGELGLDWWQGGRLKNKQNSYDDLYAVAEALVASNRAAPRTLALVGSSAGGLMAGVAATQRPDLWAVIVSRVPCLDLIGGCRNPYDRMCTMQDRANVEDPDEVRRLVTFSPYHLIRQGVSYPAVFIEAGETDPRCPAWHARKFAARLQWATAGRGSILLHIWENVGHGLATDKATTLEQNTEWLAFTLRHLGLSPI